MGPEKWLAQPKFLTRGLASCKQQRDGLQERQDASQVLPTSGRAKADAGTSGYACLALPMGHSTLARTRRKEILPMRVPVVDSLGTVLMPCTPPKARALLKAGKARPKRNKLQFIVLIKLRLAQFCMKE